MTIRLNEEYIIPGVFDKNVVPTIAKAVANAARETGTARRIPQHEKILEPDQRAGFHFLL